MTEMEGVLTSIFIERGIGMSKEMYLVISMTTDMANRLITMGTLNYTINSLLKTFSNSMSEHQQSEIEANKVKHEQAEQAPPPEQYSEEEIAEIQKNERRKVEEKKPK